MFNWKALLGRRSHSIQVVRECRVCGGKVGSETSQCPSCGSDEIAHYEL